MLHETSYQFFRMDGTSWSCKLTRKENLTKITAGLSHLNFLKTSTCQAKLVGVLRIYFLKVRLPLCLHHEHYKLAGVTSDPTKTSSNLSLLGRDGRVSGLEEGELVVEAHVGGTEQLQPDLAPVVAVDD